MCFFFWQSFFSLFLAIEINDGNLYSWSNQSIWPSLNLNQISVIFISFYYHKHLYFTNHHLLPFLKLLPENHWKNHHSFISEGDSSLLAPVIGKISWQLNWLYLLAWDEFSQGLKYSSSGCLWISFFFFLFFFIMLWFCWSILSLMFSMVFSFSFHICCSISSSSISSSNR